MLGVSPPFSYPLVRPERSSLGADLPLGRPSGGGGGQAWPQATGTEPRAATRSAAKGGWRAWRVPARSVLDGSEPGGTLPRVGDEEGWR